VRTRFPFAFEPRVAPFSVLFGVTPRTAWVDIDEQDLTVRFGLWRLTTPRRNILDGEVTGPYSYAKVAGPAHLSFADHGVTFATTTERGVCFRLREPVPGIAPFGRLPHPGVTVTVADPEGLLARAPLR
jgi:hypothetical protein